MIFNTGTDKLKDVIAALQEMYEQIEGLSDSLNGLTHKFEFQDVELRPSADYVYEDNDYSRAVYKKDGTMFININFMAKEIQACDDACIYRMENEYAPDMLKDTSFVLHDLNSGDSWNAFFNGNGIYLMATEDNPIADRTIIKGSVMYFAGR